MIVEDYFEKIRKGEIQGLDIYRFINLATNNYQPNSIVLLKKQLAAYIFELKRNTIKDPEELFLSLLNSIREKKHSLEDLIEVYDELNERRNRQSKHKYDLGRLLQFLNDDMNEEKVDDRNIYVFGIALYKFAEKHGESYMNLYVEILRLRFLDVMIDAVELELSNSNLTNRDLVNKDSLKREDIFERARELKETGMKVMTMVDRVEDWLINDLGFTEKELKERFNFSLSDPASFNRLVNKHVSF